MVVGAPGGGPSFNLTQKLEHDVPPLDESFFKNGSISIHRWTELFRATDECEAKSLPLFRPPFAAAG